MNKKFINVLLLAAVCGAGCATFTSCKDTSEDLKKEIQVGDADLQLKIDKLSSELETLKAAQEACKTECQQKIADLIVKINEANGRIDQNKQDIQTISGQISQILIDLGTKVTADDVRRIFSEELAKVGVDYYKGLGLLTADDLDGYVKAEDIADDLAQIATLVTTVGQLTTDLGNLTVIVNNLTANYNQLIEDLKNGVYNDGTGLTEDEVNALIDVAIQALQADIKLVTDALAADIVTINNNITNIQNEITALQTTTGDHETRIVALESTVANLETRLAAVETTVAEIAQIKTRLDNIETRLSVTEQKAIDAYNQAQANLASISTLEGLIGDCEGLKPLADEIRDLKGQCADIVNQINSVNTELTNKLNDLDGKIDAVNTALTQDINDLTARVAANEAAIATLQEQVNKLLKLEDRLNSLITGILVQGTFNPLYGTFSLPIGIQSNMLVNYHGQSEKQTYEFPSVQSFATFNNENEITADELRMLEASNYTHVTIENGALLLEEGDGNMGKVFVTINPNNINFAGQTLPLVNSLDQEAGVELRNLRPSQELLSFGYSRGGGNNNGFYEADATLPATQEAINKTAVYIHDNLKTSMKNILQDRRSNLRTNLVSLMRAVLDEFYNTLPAYALKAAWNVNGQDYAVYSNYSIAAATFKPLSFGFLYDKSFNHKLPIIDPLGEAILNIDTDKFKVDLSGVKVDISGINATLDISIDEIELSYEGDLTVTVTGVVKDEAGNQIGTTEMTGQVNKDAVDAFLAEIQKQFNEKIGDWNESIQNAYKESIESVLDQVNSEVERVLAELEGQINDQIADMIKDIENEINNRTGSYIDKLDRFINYYNRLANRINNVFENPNHYLQPTMLYHNGNGVHFLSGNVNRPTTFKRAGGNAVTLYATSYTGEIIAPAYKKLVACTNVIDNATKASAQGGDAALLAELKDINNTTYLAEVRPGNQRRFAINTAGMKPGHTYEILYTAVDYLGVTSTARFYFTVE